MHIFFSGIGGAGIGPLALIASQAGFDVSGSDKQHSSYLDTLQKKGLSEIYVGQSEEAIAEVHRKNPIDWVVYSSAVEKEHANHPELIFAKKHDIHTSKRDEFLSKLLTETGQKLIAVAGTHGKTTTTAMFIWAFQQLHMPISYSVGAKLSFGGLGSFTPGAGYFIYEADEYDRNFLAFTPEIAVITGIDYDHPDIYPTRDNYYEAFREFLSNSKSVVAHPEDLQRIGISGDKEVLDASQIQLAGSVNRINAQLVVQTIAGITDHPIEELIEIMNSFPGVSRRFEKISENIYTDYAHTPEKIKGAIQLTNEIAGENVVIVYEGLHNTRQHFIKKELATVFTGAKKVIVVPSYRARENESLEDLTPEKLCNLIKTPEDTIPAKLDEELKETITKHVKNGDLVLCLTAGGGGSLDEWLREQDFGH